MALTLGDLQLCVPLGCAVRELKHADMSPTCSQCCLSYERNHGGDVSWGIQTEKDARKSQLVDAFAREKAKYGVSTVPSVYVFNT